MAIFVSTFTVIAQESANFLEASVDTLTPYVGQPIVYTWQLALAAGMNAEAAQIMLPAFVGFGQEELPVGEVLLQTVNGQSMQVIQRQVVLYPLQIGTLTIEPVRILVPETPFQPAIFLESAPLTLTILPLPPAAPPTFQNAIGQFDAVAALNTTSITMGQPVILTLTITGTGNIQQMSRPNIALPDIWRVVELENKTTSTSPLFGSRVFEWQLIASQPGIHVIPIIEFSFLNPQTGGYEIRPTTSLPLEVLADANATIMDQPTPANITQTATAQTNMMLKPLPENIAPVSTILNGFGVLLWVLPPLFTSLVAFMMVYRSRPRASTTTKSPRISGSRALQQAQAQLKEALAQSPKEASVIIADVIWTYLYRKTGQTVQRANLNAISLPAPVQKSLLECLDLADAGRYAPVSEHDIKLLVRDTLRVLMELDKTWQS